MIVQLAAEVKDEFTPTFVRLAEAVGNFEGGSIYVGVRATKGSDLMMRAVANEFGVPGRIPERSYLRSTMDRNRGKYAALLADAAAAGLNGQPTRAAYEQVGAIAVADVRETISRGVPPPNAPSTIRRKGSSKPLIDTGRLWQSLDWNVEIVPAKRKLTASDVGYALAGITGAVLGYAVGRRR